MATNYNDIKGSVEPYDIFLFSGEGLISRVIQAGTGSEWSHVGISLRDNEHDMNMLFESTTLSDLPSLDTGTPIKGVTRVDLKKRVETYPGKVAWRHIAGPRQPDCYKISNAVVQKFNGRPYEKNQLELAASALDLTGLLTNQPDMSSIFCSELTAYLLDALGMLEMDRSPNEYTPADFAGDLPLTGGYMWGDTVVIKDSPKRFVWPFSRKASNPS